MSEHPLDRRRAGVLLHVASLPGPAGAGTLGADARRFVDFLVAAGFTVWQTLPLGPTDAHGSPYCVRSAYAGEPRLIDAAALAELAELPSSLDRDAVALAPLALYRSFAAAATREQQRLFAEFVRRERHWLHPHGLFRLCRARYGEPWWLWPPALKARERAALHALLHEGQEEYRAFLFEQYLFHLQWSALKRYANERGVLLFGD